MTDHRRPTAPRHLAEPTRRWWRAVVADYTLEEHHLKLLTLAAESWDRAVQARTALEEADSLTYTDRFGAPRVRPEVAIERDARLSYARLLRALDLDGGPAPDPKAR